MLTKILPEQLHNTRNRLLASPRLIYRINYTFLIHREDRLYIQDSTYNSRTPANAPALL
ncbi:hypothetical protein D3C81_982920 [compost metagenome]